MVICSKSMTKLAGLRITRSKGFRSLRSHIAGTTIFKSCPSTRLISQLSRAVGNTKGHIWSNSDATKTWTKRTGSQREASADSSQEVRTKWVGMRSTLTTTMYLLPPVIPLTCSSTVVKTKRHLYSVNSKYDFDSY